MNITIKRYPEKAPGKGMFAKPVQLFVVSCNIAFSEEETAIIAAADISGIAVRSETYHDPKLDAPLVFNTTFKGLLDGSQSLSKRFPTPVEANNYEHELRTDILPGLKSYILGSRVETTTDTFEL